MMKDNDRAKQLHSYAMSNLLAQLTSMASWPLTEVKACSYKYQNKANDNPQAQSQAMRTQCQESIVELCCVGSPEGFQMRVLASIARCLAAVSQGSGCKVTIKQMSTEPSGLQELGITSAMPCRLPVIRVVSAITILWTGISEGPCGQEFARARLAVPEPASLRVGGKCLNPGSIGFHWIFASFGAENGSSQQGLHLSDP